jgi:ATP phosphoribosyltransferase
MKKLKVAIPKGKMYENVVNLLNDAGIKVRAGERLYRPIVSDEKVEMKIVKPQNIPKLIELGSHDVGFTGHDLIVEMSADVVEVMDLKFDPVKVVAAVSENTDIKDLRRKKMVVASEYENLTRKFLEREEYDYVFLRTYGATEVFPPEDADMIIDNTSTGKTLKEQGLKPIKTLLDSSTRFVANKKALEDIEKREKINEMKMLFQAVLGARERVILEMNVSEENFEGVVKFLPCMRAPTVAPLYKGQGYAIKVAVKRGEVAKLIPQLKKLGATDILEYELRKVIA